MCQPIEYLSMYITIFLGIFPGVLWYGAYMERKRIQHESEITMMKISALHEAIELFNYGATEEAVEVLEDAKIMVRGQ